MKMQRIKDKLFETLDKAEMAKVVAGQWTSSTMPTLDCNGTATSDTFGKEDGPSPPAPMA